MDRYQSSRDYRLLNVYGTYDGITYIQGFFKLEKQMKSKTLNNGPGVKRSN